MQQKKCHLNLYVNFLISNHNRFSSVELERVSPIDDMHHDAVTRFLFTSSYTPSDLWIKVKPLVKKDSGYLIVDDSLLDKRYSRQNELARVQYSGNEHGLVNGISLVNFLWTDTTEVVPVDYRVAQKERDDLDKHQHFQAMLKRAHTRGFTPSHVLMDSWYGSITNLKTITSYGWKFITGVKTNRQVSLIKNTYMPISDLDFTSIPVQKVWLKGYGFVLAMRIVFSPEDTRYVVTNDLTLLNAEIYKAHWDHRWTIEQFHRGIKQTTGIEKCAATRAVCQLNHIFASFVAFLKLEERRLRDGVSWYEQKSRISRLSCQQYLSNA